MAPGRTQWRLRKEGAPVVPVILRTSNPEALRRAGFHLNSVLPGFATAELTREELFAAAAADAVQALEPSETLTLHNDIARAYTGVTTLHNAGVNNTAYKGSNVLVGIIDTGIDWTHFDFRDPADTTKSRIAVIWDQTLTPAGAETSPSGFSYGVEYTRTHIENELDGSPAGFVREADINGHGTHVAGTAAGNGSSLSSRRYMGMAPEADLIIVKAGDGSFTSTHIIDALTFVQQKAAALGKPVVVNMSLGSDAGPHDGSDAQSAAIDSFTGTGRVAVVSAGNSGASAIHNSITIAAGSEQEFDFSVPTYTASSGANNDYFEIDTWFSGNGAVTALMISPNADTVTQGPSGNGSVDHADGSVYFENYVRSNGDRQVYCVVYDGIAGKPPASGTWKLVLKNTSASSLTCHAWLFSKTMSTTLTGGNTDYTLGNTAAKAIIVGAWADRWYCVNNDGTTWSYGSPVRADNSSSFTSKGPTRLGAQKPDLAAPGQGIISAKPTSLSVNAVYLMPGGKHQIMQGTSMASPVVAGAVALLLQQNASLTASQVKTLLASTAVTDAFTGSVPNTTWGYGKLDIFKAMVKTINNSFDVSREIPGVDTWTSQTGVSLGAGVKVAVRFRPSFTGTVNGILVHPSTTVSITGPLYAEIWSDNGSGLPASLLGTTRSLASSDVFKYTWNFMPADSAAVAVSSGTDYHVVLYFSSGTSLTLLSDNGTVDNHSSVNTGGGWSAYNSVDFRIRPVLCKDLAGLPVEMGTVAAAVEGRSVRIAWTTITENRNCEFVIERRALSGAGAWERAGFVAGAGTSGSPRSYEFVDRALAPGRYAYRIFQIDADGVMHNAGAAEIEISESPESFAVLPNYPNPFNSTTTFRYRLPEECDVTVRVFDVLGRMVTMLAEGRFEPGEHMIRWNALSLASGSYIVKVSAVPLDRNRSAFEAVRMVTILK